jgi:hypothetical protein
MVSYVIHLPLSYAFISEYYLSIGLVLILSDKQYKNCGFKVSANYYEKHERSDHILQLFPGKLETLERYKST